MSEKNTSIQRPRIIGRGFMGGSRHIRKKVEKPKDFKTTFRKLVNYLKPYTFKIILITTFTIVSTVFSIIAPKILGKAITKTFDGLMIKLSGNINYAIDFQYIFNIILILSIIYILSSILSYIEGYMIVGISQRISYDLRKEISKKINKLPLKYFDTISQGEVLSRVTNDVDTVSQSLNQSMSRIITSTTTLIGVLIMMISISWQMTITAILMVPISMSLVRLIVKKSQAHFKIQQKALGMVNGHIEEVFAGHNIMKVFNAEEEMIKKFEDINEEFYNSAWKAQFISGIMKPITIFVGNVGYVVVSILGGWYAIQGIIEVGDILAFIQYIRNLTNPIGDIAQISNVLQSTVAAAERVFEFLHEEEETEDVKSSVKLKEIKGRVTFDKVRFGYKEDEIIINDFSIDIKPGQKVALVGPTGAGKTTIVKLLMRFYDVNEGRILIDGHDIKDFTREDLRSNFGMVLQDTWIFSGSIKENIRYGRLDAGDLEIIQAAKAAYAHRFIQTLPEGYDMIINEEASNISQGQKQLITIARAIISDPKILILDEATSSVDTRTEILIQKAMANLMKDRTSFIIAHRLSTIRDADLILVMKDGDIVEQGTHKELLDKKGFYYEIYNSQFVA